jgi:hypothetical protein
MIRRVLSWLRVVLPPGWWVVVFLLLYACTEGPVLYFERQVGRPIDLSFRPGRLWLIAGTALLAFYRVAAFHPFFRRDYFRWLKSTPWTVDKPLPMGPVELVPQDALGVGGLMLLSAIQPQTDSIELLDVFLFAHCLGIITTFWKTGVPGFGYVSTLLLGFVPRLWKDPWLDLGVLAAAYLLVHEGLWRSLARFPWAAEGYSGEQDANVRQEEQFGPPCGWPYDRFLRDVKMATAIGRTDAVLISMLVGWWVYALEDWAPAWFQPQSVIPILFQFTMVGRGFRYFQGYAPPISLSGRILTFRWIIPGYDRALVAFALLILAFPAVVTLGILLGVTARQGLPVIAAVMVLITLITPPTLRNWRLTGGHRLVAAIPKASRDFVQVG